MAAQCALLMALQVRRDLSMAMPMIQVGIVRMAMYQRFMTMPVRMRLPDRFVVLMLMMLVMNMSVFVFERIRAYVRVRCVRSDVSKVQSP
jgi:hypothetical protein